MHNQQFHVAGPMHRRAALETAWIPFVFLIVLSFYWWGRIDLGVLKIPLASLYIPIVAGLWIINLGTFRSSESVTSFPVRWTSCMTGLALMISGMTLSLFVVDSPQAGIAVLVEFVFYAGLFFIFVNTLQSRTGVRRLVTATVVGVAALAIDGTFRFFIAETSWRLGAGDVQTATNMGAFMFQVAFLLVASRVVFDSSLRWAKRCLWGTGLLAFGVALAFSYSRGAWITLSAGMLVLAFHKKSLALVYLLFALLIVPVLPEAVTGRVRSISDFDRGGIVTLEGTGSREDAVVPNTTSLRLENQRRAVQDFMRQPISGIGIGAYHGATEEQGEAAPHNSFLRILAESGPLAFLGFAMFIAALGRMVFRSPATAPEEDRWLMIGVQAVFVTQLFYLAIGDWAYQMYFWFFAALWASVGNLFAPESQFSNRDLPDSFRGGRVKVRTTPDGLGSS